MNTLPQHCPEAAGMMPPAQTAADLLPSPRVAHQHAGQFPARQCDDQSNGLGGLHSPPVAGDRAGNLCPLCRQSMRLWALDLRETVDHRDLCIRTAISFRDACLHTDREKYDALVTKLKRLDPGTRLHTGVWREIERIKNLHGGAKPVGRTFLAWQSEHRTPNIEHRTSNGGQYEF